MNIYQFIVALFRILMYNVCINSGEIRNEILQDHVGTAGGTAHVP